jgi:hypothetical protein
MFHDHAAIGNNTVDHFHRRAGTVFAHPLSGEGFQLIEGRGGARGRMHFLGKNEVGRKAAEEAKQPSRE